MRIAVWYYLPSGGGKRALYYHVRGLVQRGHHVEVWCPQSVNRDYLPLGEFAQEHTLPLEPTFMAHGLRARGVGHYQYMQAKIAAMDRHCQACADEIHLGGFDVLFANTCYEFGAAAIGRWVDLPSGLYLGEPNRPLYEAWPTLHWLAPETQAAGRSPRQQAAWARSRWGDLVHNSSMRLKARQELTNAKAYDAIWVNSYFSRESILRAYGLDAQVCYLGVDTDSFRTLDLPRENFIVSLGELGAHKNAKFIIEALALLPVPRPRLVWIGNKVDEDYLCAMQMLAEKSGVSFELRRHVSHDELIDLLNRARAMAYAPRLEPFGFAPLEANACSLPVAAKAEGGVRETVQDGVNGYLVEPTLQGMAEGIARLCGNPAGAQEMGQTARQIVLDRWSLVSCVDRIEACLTRLTQHS